MRLAVIPARGGSKRIPRKNIRDFAGRPIIAWVIEAAQKSGVCDRVIVSTDDAEIAAVATQYGAEVPFLRPADLADDFTGTNAVVKHAIGWFIARGEPVAHACCLYATAPLVQAGYLEQGYRLLAASDAAFALAVTSFPFPIQRALRITATGRIDPFHPEHRFTRSQDLEPAYHDAGQFLWGSAKAFLDELTTYSPLTLPVLLPRHLVQDIDSEEDWQRAELLARLLREEGAS